MHPSWHGFPRIFVQNRPLLLFQACLVQLHCHIAMYEITPLLSQLRHCFRRALSDYIAISVWRATHPAPPASQQTEQTGEITADPLQPQPGETGFQNVAGVELYDEWGVDVLMQVGYWW